MALDLRRINLRNLPFLHDLKPESDSALQQSPPLLHSFLYPVQKHVTHLALIQCERLLDPEAIAMISRTTSLRSLHLEGASINRYTLSTFIQFCVFNLFVI
jgi:hypothetical protein